jgi:hypothetical protein
MNLDAFGEGILTELSNHLTSGVDLAAGQLQDIYKQILRWKVAVGISIITLWLLPLSGLLLISFVTWELHTNSGRSIGLTVFLWAFSLWGVIGVFVLYFCPAIRYALQAIIAPKIAMIEIIREYLEYKKDAHKPDRPLFRFRI